MLVQFLSPTVTSYFFAEPSITKKTLILRADHPLCPSFSLGTTFISHPQSAAIFDPLQDHNTNHAIQTSDGSPIHSFGDPLYHTLSTFTHTFTHTLSTFTHTFTHTLSTFTRIMTLRVKLSSMAFSTSLTYHAVVYGLLH